MIRHSTMFRGRALLLASIFAVWALLATQARGEEEVPLSALSAQWWQLVLSVPSSASPLTDISGDNCMVGQRGNVWFLYGTLGGNATRKCSVPQGKPLFFPVVNNFVVNTPGVCGQPASLVYSVSDARSLVAPFIDSFNPITDLSVTLDGTPVQNLLRVKSVPFIAALPADNIFVPFCAPPVNPPGQPAGIFSPGVDDGYYVLLHPLNLGTHTLHIVAGNPSFLEVTYSLTVIPVSLE